MKKMKTSDYPDDQYAFIHGLQSNTYIANQT